MPNGVNLFGKIFGCRMESLLKVVMISLPQVSAKKAALDLYNHIKRALRVGIIWQIA